MSRAPAAPSNPSPDPSSRSLAQRVKFLLNTWYHRNQKHNLRQSIASLVEESVKSNTTTPDVTPEFDRHERLLISNILHLRDITADDVMVPRADIFAIEDTTTFDQALEIMRHENHSRVPVYHEVLDNIVGMLHVKDLIAYTGLREEFKIKDILRQPLFIAPQISVMDLLLQMRSRRVHLALVVDEYGGIDGLVTIEDLVETIVGDIADEHDDPEVPMIFERDDKTFDVDGRLLLDELEKRIGPFLTSDEENSDIDTVGGLVFRIAEHVPAKGEVLNHNSGLIFRVLEADPRHIRRLRVQLPKDWNSPDQPKAYDNLEERN